MRFEAKNKVFPIRISKREEELLKQEAHNQNKSMALLIREGYLQEIKNIKTSINFKTYPLTAFSNILSILSSLCNISLFIILSCVCAISSIFCLSNGRLQLVQKSAVNPLL